jgi:hypothetical protein
MQPNIVVPHSVVHDTMILVSMLLLKITQFANILALQALKCRHHAGVPYTD